MLDVDQLRRTARHLDADVLIGVQGSRLVLVIGRADPPTDDGRRRRDPLPFLEIAKQLEPGFGAGHLVLGHEVPALVDAAKSARAALAGFAVARAWRNAPRPTLADDLLPERALAGDPLARATLINRIYRPLQAHSTELLDDAVVLPRQRPLARGDRARAVRAPEHRALPPQARLRGDRLGCHRRPRGAHPAGGAHRRLDRRPDGPRRRRSPRTRARRMTLCGIAQRSRRFL